MLIAILGTRDTVQPLKPLHQRLPGENRMVALKPLYYSVFGVLLMWVLSVSQPALAVEGLRNDAPQRYEVVPGDTLWDISGMFLKYLLHDWPSPFAGRKDSRVGKRLPEPLRRLQRLIHHFGGDGQHPAMRARNE